MRLDRAISGIAVALVVAAAPSGGCAQGAEPAERPPADWASPDYVDSRGCVFIRAAFGDQTAWVPRVSADRQPVCGKTPSVARVETAPVVVAVAAPAPAPAPRRSTRAAAPARVAPIPVSSDTPPRNDMPPGPPRGYKPAFDDGRLNPLRGERTAAGRIAMNRIWTNDVPMRLVESPPR
jgi:hypothetical protein